MGRPMKLGGNQFSNNATVESVFVESKKDKRCIRRSILMKRVRTSYLTSTDRRSVQRNLSLDKIPAHDTTKSTISTSDSVPSLVSLAVKSRPCETVVRPNDKAKSVTQATSHSKNLTSSNPSLLTSSTSSKSLAQHTKAIRTGTHDFARSLSTVLSSQPGYMCAQLELNLRTEHESDL